MAGALYSLVSPYFRTLYRIEDTRNQTALRFPIAIRRISGLIVGVVSFEPAGAPLIPDLRSANTWGTPRPFMVVCIGRGCLTGCALVIAINCDNVLADGVDGFKGCLTVLAACPIFCPISCAILSSKITPPIRFTAPVRFDYVH
jgi:hypothetical protein